MKKLQAAMRDAAFRRARERRYYYRVGSYFKGCQNCGETEMVPAGNRMVKRYKTGLSVFRAYRPQNMGWTYWCWDCGAKDEVCWEKAQGLGEDAYRPTKDETMRVFGKPKDDGQPKGSNPYSLEEPNQKPKSPGLWGTRQQPVQRVESKPTKANPLDSLQAKIDALEKLLKGVK